MYTIRLLEMIIIKSIPIIVNLNNIEYVARLTHDGDF